MLLRVDHGRADLLGSNTITHSLPSSPRVDGVEADSTRRRADADSMVAVEQTSRRWRVLCIDANLMAPGRDSVDAVEAGRSSTASAVEQMSRRWRWGWQPRRRADIPVTPRRRSAL